MKAILEFDLSEEQSEFTLAIKNREFYSRLWDIDMKMRAIVKHGHKYKSVEELAEAVREMIGDLDCID